ncbi:MAG: SEL1-like repeat protein [Muribaculaceae bacterium]|nr:SEL1-like repeat protein [Muribaculaceae bacterium]
MVSKSSCSRTIEAEYSLGFCYYNGYGVEENNDEAFRWFKIAADKGNSKAQYYTGKCYFNGWGVDKDKTEAVRWYRMAAEQGESEAQFRLGDCYSLGWGVVENKVEATKWFRKAAEQGDARAQCELGTAYHLGAEYGVEENEEEAIKWYKKSAEQDCAYAACCLGDIYFSKGNSLEGSQAYEAYAQSIEWYKKAIELDRDEEEEGDVYYSLSSLSYGEAAYNLGEMYYYGRGVEEDEEEAHSWYEEYADLCNDPSPFYGEVEPSSPENLAAHEFGLLLTSAQEGDADAQFFVGLRYVNGQGVEKNDAEAVKWFLKAAQQGHSDAQYLVGVCYNKGLGVEQSYAEARKWYEKAIQSGNVKAQEKLNGLNSALFEGFWVENALHGVQLNLEYDRSNNTISGTLYGQEEICSGNGTVKGNTLNLSCSDGYTVTCTLSGGKLKIKVKSRYSNFGATLERN